MQRIHLSILLLLVIEARDVLAQGCAMCGSFGQTDPAGRAISFSVLFLMAMPYVLSALVASVFLVARRRARTIPPLQPNQGDLA